MESFQIILTIISVVILVMTLQRLILERIPTVKEVAKYSINALLTLATYGIWLLFLLVLKWLTSIEIPKDADWDDKLIRKYLPAIVVIVVSGGWFFFFLVIQLILQHFDIHIDFNDWSEEDDDEEDDEDDEEENFNR